MTVVDIILLFVIALSAVFGVLRGFVKEAISLVKWILATWVAATFSSKLAPMMPLDSETAAQASAFAALFILVFLVGAMVSFALSSFIKSTGLSGADRVFGLLFGVLRGAVIIVVLVVVGQTVALSSYQWWQDSQVIEVFERITVRMQDYLPEMKESAIDTEQIMQKGAEHVIDNVDPEVLMEQMNK